MKISINPYDHILVRRNNHHKSPFEKGKFVLFTEDEDFIITRTENWFLRSRARACPEVIHALEEKFGAGVVLFIVDDAPVWKWLDHVQYEDEEQGGEGMFSSVYIHPETWKRFLTENPDLLSAQTLFEMQK